MDEVYICELCQRAYEPEEVVPGGIRRLKTFKGYTVDLRLRQFRKVPMSHSMDIEFVEFADPLGRALLAQMHEEVTR